jgi:hypothetical protein
MPHSDPGAPTRRAILIGVDAYPGLGPEVQLRGCVNDARELRDLLVEGLCMDAADITLLTSPRHDRLDGELPADAQAVRSALAALLGDGSLEPGSHVVLFLAGHGVALRRGAPGARKELYYGFAPSDATDGHEGMSNLLLDRELNHFLRSLQRRGVSTTLIADTCHSGSSTRAIGGPARERSLPVRPLSDAAFDALVAHHPALAPGVERVLSGPAGRYGGYDAADFVVLAACQDHQTAKEDAEEELGPDGALRVVEHGMFTRALVDVLRRMPGALMATLRWQDVHEALVRAMLQRLGERRAAGEALTDQAPALEGRRERLVFGGAFRPRAPGFTLRVDGQRLLLDGGFLHGLEPGAVVAVHPPDAADFAAPAICTAVVVSATGATSVLEIEPGGASEGAPVADRSRCCLLTHAPARRPVRVRWVGVPEPIRASASEVAGALVEPTVASGPDEVPAAHLEVRSFTGVVPAGVREGDPGGAPAAWVLVRAEVDGAPGEASVSVPSADDIVAYVPALAGADPDARLGAAIGAGLAHYARYLHARERSYRDDGLLSLISVRLLGAHLPAEVEDGEALGDAHLALFEPLQSSEGRYEIDRDLALFVEVSLTGRLRLRLSLGLVAFSDDGNVVPLWPAEGQEPTLVSGQTLRIGIDRFRPLWLNTRADQARSLWTLKLLAASSAEGSASVNVAALAQAQTVQDVIASALSSSRGAVGRGLAPAAAPAFGTWEMRVVVRR